MLNKKKKNELKDDMQFYCLTTGKQQESLTFFYTVISEQTKLNRL